MTLTDKLHVDRIKINHERSACEHMHARAHARTHIAGRRAVRGPHHKVVDENSVDDRGRVVHIQTQGYHSPDRKKIPAFP